MRASLEFNLDDFDLQDKKALARCLKAEDMANVIFEIVYNLKKKCTWELEALEADSDKWDGLEVVMRNLLQLIEENGINIDELIQ